MSNDAVASLLRITTDAHSGVTPHDQRGRYEAQVRARDEERRQTRSLFRDASRLQRANRLREFIATGWTECAALPLREQTLIVEALAKMRTDLPFPMRGLDTDNDSAFMNETLQAYCRENGLEWTRSRAYKKNDQAWVEQKNGAVVRRLLGYGRLSGMQATAAVAALYANARLYLNFFQPCFKLKSKQRDGALVRKQYHAPRTPFAQVLANEAIDATAT